MKILVLNDLHITSTPPAGCREIYLEDIFNMLEECRLLIEEEDIDTVIFTGDIFHRRTIPVRVLNRLIKVLKSFRCRRLAISGNHDQDSAGVEGIPNTPFGTLIESGAIEWMKDEDVYLSDVKIEVQISPANYFDGIDSDPNNYRLNRYEWNGCDCCPKEVDWAIKVAHGSLLRPGKKYPFEVLTYDQIPTEGMDLMLFGHIHNNQNVMKVNGTYFAGLGSIGRVARTDYNIRKPSVLLVTLSKKKMKFEEIILDSAVEPEELYYEKDQEAISADIPMARFARDMEKKLRLGDVSLDEALASVTSKGVDGIVVKIVKDHLTEAGY